METHHTIKRFWQCASAVSRNLRVGDQKWNPRPHIGHSLYNFQGAAVIIKGSLLMSLPTIKRFWSDEVTD